MKTESLSRIAALIGFARRAGKIRLGTNLTLAAVQGRQALLVLVASDASERTKKQLCDKCISHSVKLVPLPLTTDEMARAAGKSAPIAALAVTDSGFAREMTRLAEEANDTNA